MYNSPTIALVLWCHLVVAPIVGTFGLCFGVHGNGSRLGPCCVVFFVVEKNCKKTWVNTTRTVLFLMGLYIKNSEQVFRGVKCPRCFFFKIEGRL